MALNANLFRLAFNTNLLCIAMQYTLGITRYAHAYTALDSLIEMGDYKPYYFRVLFYMFRHILIMYILDILVLDSSLMKNS